MAEIKEFLDIRDRVKVKLSEKIVEIEQQIKRLQLLKLELEGLLEGEQQIPETLEETICPIIEQT